MLCLLPIPFSSPLLGLTLRDAIKTHPKYATHRFTQYRMAENPFSLVARDRAFESAFKGWGEQLKQLKEKTDKRKLAQRPPLNATIGAPGSGKTRFLDEVAQLDQLARFALNPELCDLGNAKYFQSGNVLVINITFNGDMGKVHNESKHVDKESKHVEMLTSRLLFRYSLYSVCACVCMCVCVCVRSVSPFFSTQ